MSMTKMEYAETKGLLEEVQRQPAKIRREILTMLRGAIVISDMYARNQTTHPPAPANSPAREGWASGRDGWAKQQRRGVRGMLGELRKYIQREYVDRSIEMTDERGLRQRVTFQLNITDAKLTDEEDAKLKDFS